MFCKMGNQTVPQVLRRSNIVTCGATCASGLMDAAVHTPRCTLCTACTVRRHSPPPDSISEGFGGRHNGAPGAMPEHVHLLLLAASALLNACLDRLPLLGAHSAATRCEQAFFGSTVCPRPPVCTHAQRHARGRSPVATHVLGHLQKRGRGGGAQRRLCEQLWSGLGGSGDQAADEGSLNPHPEPKHNGSRESDTT